MIPTGAGAFAAAAALLTLIVSGLVLLHRRDVRRLGKVHDELARRERRYRRLVEAGEALICEHDLEGRLLSVNEAVARQAACRPEEMVGRNLAEFLSPSVRDEFPAYLDRIRRERVVRGSMSVLSRDGAELVWEFVNTRVEEPGEPPFVLGHAQDVTSRVIAERDRRRSEHRYRVVVESLDEAILVVSPSAAVLSCNRSAAEILGLDTERILDRDWREIFPRAVAEDGTELTAAQHPPMVTLRTGIACSGVVIGGRRPTGERIWLLVGAYPLRDELEAEPHAIAVSLRDITERKRREIAKEEDLNRALTSVKVLRGLLPICAACKKIRADDGYWTQVEVYIRDHSEANFTHGICPDCMAGLYGRETHGEGKKT